MKLLSFYTSVLFLIAYLTLDIVLVDTIKEGRPLVQLVAGLTLVSMLFYNLVYAKRIKKIFYNWSFLLYWGGFVVIIIGYYLLSFFDLPTKYAVSHLNKIVIAIFIYTTIIFSYLSTIKGHLQGRILLLLIVFLVINGLFEIYYAFNFAKIKSGIEEINTSAGYVFVMILPMLMYLYRSNYLWVFGVTLVLTMLTGKRGALVIYLVLMLYMLWKYRIFKSQSSFNWKSLFFLGCLLLGGIYFYENAFSSLSYRLATIQTSDGSIGSGRNIIWSTLINYWFNAHFAYQMLGSGFFSTIGINRYIAHNDYIEYLVDFGVIGFTIWLFVVLKFYKNIQQVRLYNSYLYILLVFCLLILIGRGLIAGTLRTDQIYLSISIGYLLGAYKKQS